MTEIASCAPRQSQGDAFDNALAESAIELYKTEVIRRRGPWHTLEAVEFATLEWVDWFNMRRLLGPIGDVPPAEFEAQYYEQAKVACSALVAADFWEEKDFTTWSDEEVREMLTDSPWAKSVRITVSRGATERANVTITWKSALPIKQALARQAIGLDASLPLEHQQALERAEPFYAVTVSGLPPTFRWLATRRDALKAMSMLGRKGSAPIAPESVRLFQDTQSQLISVEFLFPKTDAITLDDRDVEVITRLGNADVKKTFKLADMVFGDKLAL